MGIRSGDSGGVGNWSILFSNMNIVFDLFWVIIHKKSIPVSFFVLNEVLLIILKVLEYFCYTSFYQKSLKVFKGVKKFSMASKNKAI